MQDKAEKMVRVFFIALIVLVGMVCTYGLIETIGLNVR
jgi:hypothetical protein